MIYTCLLEIGGGTYIKQVGGKTSKAAARNFSRAVARDAEIPRGQMISQAIDEKLQEANPLEIDGLQYVWCLVFREGRRLGILNIVGCAVA